MLEEKLLQHVINDILLSGEYDLDGISRYTDTPFEVILEFSSGINIKPSALCLRKIIGLHSTIRPNEYHAIIMKILNELNPVNTNLE